VSLASVDALATINDAASSGQAWTLPAVIVGRPRKLPKANSATQHSSSAGISSRPLHFPFLAGARSKPQPRPHPARCGLPEVGHGDPDAITVDGGTPVEDWRQVRPARACLGPGPS
jgi:hypothetical protein